MDNPPDELTDDSGKTEREDPETNEGTDPKTGEGDPDKPENPDKGTDPITDPKDPPKGVDPPTPPEPKPPKPKVNPFAKLAKSVDLPALGSTSDPNPEATKRMIIGDLKLAEFETTFFAEMSGGDQAYNSKQVFVMRNADRGLDERAFEIYLKKSNNDELMIAKWGIEEQKLWFEWTNKAQQEVASNYVRNCLLTLNTGTETHQLALRKPVSMGRLAIDMDKVSGGKIDARLDYLPSADFISVEISVAKNFPPHKLANRELEVTGKNSSTKLLLGEPGQEILYFYIKSALKGKGGLEITALPKLYPQQRKMTAFNKTTFDKETEQMTRTLQSAPLQLAAYDREITKAGQNQQLKKLIKQRKAQFESQLTNAQAQVASRNKLVQFIKRVEESAIQVRVFYRAGDYQVDLAQAN
ncbi:MAG: hypothetical protein IH991_17925 [Planctomycetes bacterium]|nr:hypothetical protein [Planctomycetota bacterium]